MRPFPLLLAGALVLVTTSPCSAQIFHKKKKVDKSTAASNTAEPDKQLYDKAMEDIKRGRHEVGRLGLQTLINTYPDSEYLAKAKLAIADSYFKEGGTSNITQAIAGYKDFIVFFPFLPEAGYAQMQVAMANYNEMAKADRDNTHARAAEEEFQTFLQKYPKDPLVPQAQQHLREVQEILAEGQFVIGYYYYVKGDRRAAAGRLIPLVKRYPLYSKSDTALWMLGDMFAKSERKDIAGSYYAQIVKNYPLSKRAPDAKTRLKDFGMPIPQADPKAVAWMTAEQNAPHPHETLPHRALGMFHPSPDVHAAARSGEPQMQADSSPSDNTDILNGANRSTALTATAGTGAGTSGTGVVLTVKPGEEAPAGSATTEGAAEETATPTGGTSETPAATTPAESASTTPAADSTDATNSSKPADAPATATPSNQKESSSKKKGLKKLIPW